MRYVIFSDVSTVTPISQEGNDESAPAATVQPGDDRAVLGRTLAAIVAERVVGDAAAADMPGPTTVDGCCRCAWRTLRRRRRDRKAIGLVVESIETPATIGRRSC